MFRVAKYKNSPLHRRKSNLSTEQLVAQYIDGGVLINFRRQFRMWVMVSSASSESQTVLKSRAKIRAEERRHLRKFYYMIHPFSSARITWEIIMIFVYMSLFIVMPVELSRNKINLTLSWSKFPLDIASFVDIGLFFCTGYYDKSRNRVVMKPKNVCIHYLKTYFIFDMMSSLPVSMLLYYTNKPEYKAMKALFVFKLVRVPTMINYFKKLCLRLQIWNYQMTLVPFTISLCTLAWFTTLSTFGNYRITRSEFNNTVTEAESIFPIILECCYKVVRTLMLVDMNSVYAIQGRTLVMNLTCIMLGFIANVLILAKVVEYYTRRSSSRNKYESLMQETNEYMNYKELSATLRKRIIDYVDLKFQAGVFDESLFLSTLSKKLKQDVMFHRCKNMVEKVDFFKYLSSRLLLGLVVRLKSEFYLAGDLIVEAGIVGNAMYFIYVGTVAVYTSTGIEICHLEDGDHFGEISLIINEPRVASVVAVTNCELFRLSRKDFLETVEPHPSIRQRIRSSALERLHSTQSFLTKDDLK